MATELSQDLIIPAYTDTELTVKKVEKGVTGIDYGTVIPSASQTEITVQHNLKTVPKVAIIFAQYKNTTSYEDKFTTLAIKSDRMLSNFKGYAQYGLGVCAEDYPGLESYTSTSKNSETITFCAVSEKAFKSDEYIWFAIA